MLNRVLVAILNKQQALAKDVVEMPVGDFATYKNLCGIYAGLQEAVTIIENLMKDADHDE